jgi:hypothetical protein
MLYIYIYFTVSVYLCNNFVDFYKSVQREEESVDIFFIYIIGDIVFQDRAKEPVNIQYNV